MEERRLYEMIGRLQLRTEQQDAAYGTLVDLLAKVVSGEIDRSRVLVNLTDRKWEYVEPGCRPGMPAQINGLPECVTAPDEVVALPYIPVELTAATAATE